MTDIENVLSSMSTAFNSSPTPGDEASVIDLNDDKTLKWRRHLKNQYAKKTRKSLADDDLGLDESLTGKNPAASEDGNDDLIDGVAATPKAATHCHPSADERIRSTPPSTPEPAAPASSSSVAATAATVSTSSPVQSAVASSDNDVISTASARDEPAKAMSTDIAVRTQKPKKSPRNVQENPARRSNRTRTILSVSPAPQRRRGRSKKVDDPASIEPDTAEEEPIKVEVEAKPSSPNATMDHEQTQETAKVPEESVIDVDKREENQTKESTTDTTRTVQNGEVCPVVKDSAKETEQEGTRNRKRRSVRLETKSDTAEAADKPLQNDTPAEKISKQLELSAEVALKAPDPETIKIEPPSPPPKVIDKIPKKRGRRPKSVVSPATSSSDVPVQSKKSPRQTRDGVENGSQEKSSSFKDNKAPNPAGQETKPSATSQRPLRRIKPTAKILENDELRYEFESKNIARIVATTSGSPPRDSRPTTGNSSEHQRASRSRDAKDTSHVDARNHVTPVKKKTTSMLNVDNIYPSRKGRPCPEPQDFLNEIKAAGINLNRSPEDKKLNRKQHRKLLKQKEKHFERLGLRRNVQDDVTDSDISSSDNDEFIPSKKINVGKPNVTLRIRNNKENATSSTSTPKPLSKPRDERPGPPKKVGVPGVGPTLKKVATTSESPADGELKMICLCQTKPKFYARKNSEVVYCKAIDHVEDHRVGCFNRIQNAEIFPLYRPSTRVPYLLLCEQHLIRFRSHNCCAGCGLFCTQGSFILCKHRHFFHPSCAEKFILNTPYDPSKRSSYPSPKLVLKCPHCGCDTSEKESLVTMKCQNTPVFLPSQKGPIKPAKMGLSSSNGRVSIVRQQSQQCLDLVKYIPESVMNVVVRENGASINDFTTKDMFYAVNNDDLERVAEIIRSGFDITSEMKEFLDGTCLHLVAHFGTIQMACLLLARNSTSEFLNQRDKEGRTAAMCAILGDKCDILQLFIQVGADISLKGEDGLTCLHFASRNDNVQAAKNLLESYSSTVSFKQFSDYLNAKDDGGWTSLIWATELNHTSVVSLLLNYDADASICDMENNTALHWAVISCCDDIVKILLQADARSSVQNISGDTPLHIACRQSNTCAALMLIARGADLMVKNNEGQIPYDCVRDEDDPCARAVGFNMQMRSIGPSGLHAKVICSDISNGRESYPIEVVRRAQKSKINDDIDDDTILPDFRYISKSILLQNSIQIDQRVSQMRICSCVDSCNSEKCQCSTISVQNWYTSEGRLNGDFNFDDPPMIFECNDVCGCNKLLCKNRVVQNGMKLPLQVFECEQRTKGWGVRTLREIPRGSFVAEYTGEILTDMEADRRTDDSYFFDLGSSDHCIDANYYGNISRFFNHACSPNIVPVRVYYDHQDYRFPKIAFFACKNIAVGEELAFDYGEKFWAVKQKYFTCKCKSAECRFSSTQQSDKNPLVNGSDQTCNSTATNPIVIHI